MKMTTKVSPVMLSPLLLVLLSFTEATGQPADYDLFAHQVDQLLAERTSSSAPGVAAVFTEAGRTIFKQCYGLADLEHGVPITTGTAFNLAAAAKQFTAFSILLLEQEGHISLDDDVHRYLPELPEYSRPVTIRHLLHHTSGIWEYSSTMLYYCGYDQRDHFTLEEILDLLQHQEALLFEPGSQWSYCNTNYVLLAQSVGRITGVPFQQWTKTRILDPLGMEHSFFIENSSQVIPGKAEPYSKANGEFVDGSSNWVNYVGQGYLFTTIDDMILWMDNFRTRKLGGDDLVQKMFRRATLNDGSESFYGYGLGVLTRSGKLVVSHSGQTGGYKAYMLYCPELQVGLTLLANERSIDCERLGDRIFDLYLGNGASESAATASAPAGGQPDFLAYDAEAATRFGGGYVVESMGAKLAVNAEQDYLHSAFWGLGEDFFYPVGERSFANRARTNLIEFMVGENGVFDQAVVTVHGQQFAARRIRLDAKEVEARFPDYLGSYYSKTFDVVYRCRIEKGRLVMHHRRYGDMQMQPIDRDEFLFILGFVRFTRDPSGEVVGFTLTPSDEGFHFRAIEFTRLVSAR